MVWRTVAGAGDQPLRKPGRGQREVSAAILRQVSISIQWEEHFRVEEGKREWHWLELNYMMLHECIQPLSQKLLKPAGPIPPNYCWAKTRTRV